MNHAALSALALLPTEAFAAFECTVLRQCGGTREARAGGPFVMMPPQGGMSGRIGIFPKGQFLFTAHAAGPVPITGEGTCAAAGG